jgi:PIN domain nuclease of toxin-antitoxin system
VIILDAYAVLALLRDEPAAAEVQRLLTGDERCALTAVGIAEVLDRVIRIQGADPDEAVLDLADLGLTAGIEVDSALMLRVGVLRARNYHRVNRQVSLADCVAAEVTRRERGRLATSDPHLLDLCHDEGIGVLVLPDSAGQTWLPRLP